MYGKYRLAVSNQTPKCHRKHFPWLQITLASTEALFWHACNDYGHNDPRWFITAQHQTTTNNSLAITFSQINSSDQWAANIVRSLHILMSWRFIFHVNKDIVTPFEGDRKKIDLKCYTKTPSAPHFICAKICSPQSLQWHFLATIFSTDDRYELNITSFVSPSNQQRVLYSYVSSSGWVFHLQTYWLAAKQQPAEDVWTKLVNS